MERLGAYCFTIVCLSVCLHKVKKWLWGGIRVSQTQLVFIGFLHAQSSTVFSSTGHRPASLCHGLLSVVCLRPAGRVSVRPCVNFFFKHLLLWNYLSDFDEISQKCSCHCPLQNCWKNLILSKTRVAMATKLKKKIENFENLLVRNHEG